DPRVAPGCELLVADGDVRAEEGDEDGERRAQPLPPRLEVVPELVDQDQGDEARGELPAPEQRVSANGDEDAGELDRTESVLGHEPAPEAGRRQQPLGGAAPGGAGVNRLVVPGDLGRFHGFTVAGRKGTTLRAPADPFLAAFVDLLLPQRNRLLEPVDRL